MRRSDVTVPGAEFGGRRIADYRILSYVGAIDCVNLLTWWLSRTPKTITGLRLHWLSLIRRCHALRGSRVLASGYFVAGPRTIPGVQGNFEASVAQRL